MNEDIAQKFINSVVKNLQVLCHSNVDFQKNVEVIGHLYLNVDSCTKLNYIVNEKVCKNEASSTVFVSNSFHAELGLKKKDKEPSGKSVDEVAQRLQRSHAQNEFTRRNSHGSETSSNNHKRDREIQGHNFHMESKMRRLSSEPTELRQSSSISSNSKSKHSQDSPISLSNIKTPVIEVDLAKVKKEYMGGGGGCSEDGGDNDESSACRSNTDTDISSIDFSTAFPISLHQSQNLSSTLNIPDISGSGNSNNIHSAASPLDQKPFVHNSNIDPPQFPPMVAGGSPRLRPPWLGDHSTGSSSASSNFPDLNWCQNVTSKNVIRRTSGKFTCHICQKLCANYNQLEGHINSHTQSKPHVCEKCGNCYAYMSDLKKHVTKLCKFRAQDNTVSEDFSFLV